MHNYALKSTVFLYDLVYALVFLGGTWKDWGAIDMRREWKQLRAGWEPGKGTGRNEVLNPDCCIVAGLFYFI